MVLKRKLETRESKRMVKAKSRVPELTNRFIKAANEARVETIEEVGNIAQQNAPVRTGELRDSKVTEHTENASLVTFTAPHFLFVEFGTYKMAANPFFLAAVVRAKDIFRKKIKEKLGKK